MTDVLDADLLSQNEVTPKAAALPPPDEATIACEFCPATFKKGPAGWLERGRHVKAKHPEHWGGPKKPTKPGGAQKAVAPKKPTNATQAKRRPLGETLGAIFLQFGRIVNTAVDAPTGAALMFEAGALGHAVDHAIAGTFVDKQLQKGATVADRFEPLVDLAKLPVLTFMLSRNPAMVGALEGELREAIEDVLVQSLPLLKRRAERSRATVSALSELRVLDPSLADSQDPIGDILGSFFAPPAQPPPEGDGGE